MAHPTQPLHKPDGVVRFKENAIVNFLYENYPGKMNALRSMPFKQEDWEQFYQLIGYSLCGYHELSNVSDEAALAATQEAKKLFPDAAGCRDRGCEVHCGIPKEISGL